MLQILLAAYKLFDERVVAIAINKKTKTTNIKELFNSNIGYLTFSKIKTLLPNVSDITISRTLRELQKNKYIKKIGKNKFAKYIKI
jgi:DNA-binding HxlR family transcriptional regulator